VVRDAWEAAAEGVLIIRLTPILHACRGTLRNPAEGEPFPYPVLCSMHISGLQIAQNSSLILDSLFMTLGSLL
jgi:hypothetical protein